MTDRVPMDINCDLGEGEPRERTEELISLIDSANIACGGHAGDDASQRFCLETAARRNVRPGAHPGLEDRSGFGRAEVTGLTPGRLAALLDEQVGRLAVHARGLGVVLHHVKLHGALYHAVEAEPALTEAYLGWVAERHPGLKVYARAGGAVERASRRRPGGVEVWAEGFLDRGYLPDGTLVPRGQPGALLDSPGAVRERWRELVGKGGVRAIDGRWLPLAVRTVCVHGDGAESVSMLRAVRDSRRSP